VDDRVRRAPGSLPKEIQTEHCTYEFGADFIRHERRRKMRDFARRHVLWLRTLRRRGTSLGPLNRSVSSVGSSSSSEAPVVAALEWPRKETRREAEARNEKRLEVLLPRLSEVGHALDECDSADHPCRLPICALCALAYRETAIPQLHALANAYVGPHQVVTIYLLLLEPGFLADADLMRIREMFRKRLDRAGFKGKLVMGGIEVAWQERRQRWLVHAHVLAIGVDAVTWKQLRAALKDSGTAQPVVTQRLKNPNDQLSYCIKFATYHRPGRKRVPLKPDRLVELAAWSSRYRFEDFLFVYEVPRPGGRIVVSKLPGDTDASARGQGLSRKSALNSEKPRIVDMPLNRNNKAEPHVGKTPIIEPRTGEAASFSQAEQPHDELSLIRAEIAAAVAQVQAEFRTAPAAEVIREIEDEMAPALDPTRVRQENILWRKWALEEKKKAARRKRLDAPFPKSMD
jgi:hypothetical protein